MLKVLVQLRIHGALPTPFQAFLWCIVKHRQLYLFGIYCLVLQCQFCARPIFRRYPLQSSAMAPAILMCLAFLNNSTGCWDSNFKQTTLSSQSITIIQETKHSFYQQVCCLTHHLEILRVCPQSPDTWWQPVLNNNMS